MGGQTNGETMGYKYVARVGAGVNPENMHSERVDGYNPLAVADAVARKKAILLEGKGPDRQIHRRVHSQLPYAQGGQTYHRR